MTKQLPSFESPEGPVSEDYTTHDSELLMAAPVKMLVSLKDIPRDIASSIRDERRENARLNAEAAKRAVEANAAVERLKIDSLTGLPNRHKFEEEYPAIFNRHDVALLFIDVRGLKQVNDKISPAEGDNYLRGVAGLIAKNKRAGDRVYRIGGDEFVVLVDAASENPDRKPDENLSATKGRIWKDIEDKLSEWYHLSEDFDLGVYVGGALKQPGDTPEDLQQRAGKDCSLAKELYDKQRKI